MKTLSRDILLDRLLEGEVDAQTAAKIKDAFDLGGLLALDITQESISPRFSAVFDYGKAYILADAATEGRILAGYLVES